LIRPDVDAVISSYSQRATGEENVAWMIGGEDAPGRSSLSQNVK
jgi:hypothetical protein